MKNIIIFGPPGTGKGTMSQKLSEEFGFRHISTGDIIRKNQEEKTKIGLLADRIVNDGNLLPDDIVNEMIKQELIDDTESIGFIFDGFPRTAGQAKMLDQFLNKRGTPVNTVIHLDVPKWVAQNRIIERGKTSGRKDDTAEAFPTRWAAYQKETTPAMNYFEGRGKVSKVNSELAIDEVYAEVTKIINGSN
jgi:adenylate kinase